MTRTDFKMKIWSASIFLLYILFVPLAGYSRILDLSESPFVVNTGRHIGRLPSMGLILKHDWPLAFFNISESDITSYLQTVHDSTKLMSLEELRTLGYTDDRPLYERFSEFYGKHRSELTRDEDRALQNIIDDHERAEEILKARFFRYGGYSNRQIDQLKLVESVVDRTDVGIGRRAEFHLGDTVRYDGASYLTNVIHDHFAAVLSRYLEDVLSGSRARMISNQYKLKETPPSNNFCFNLVGAM